MMGSIRLLKSLARVGNPCHVGAVLTLLCAAAGPATAPATQPGLTANVTDAKGLDYAIEKLHAPMRMAPPLSAAEEAKKFTPRAGLAVDLLHAEPTVRQPLCINFDERGRMWVVQYIQYPFPAGLKVVEYDKYIRAKFDKVPPPPPNHFPGRDVISIFEDTKHDGSFSSVKTFVSGLNITTSALPGRGGRGADDYGVWVMNPPYLLFYPDKNRDDVPDGDPIVHLSGFGLEDTHAVANNLTWGPDGWLYGCQGSTCTAKVKTHLGDTSKTTDFLGQAIWRYHPERHVFEIFAEGGGNTFGLEFDDHGNAFSGTNWGKYRGLHFVQGGYYVKGWGKHGPLTNPYAFGFFEHMPHEGNADRLSHTYIVYGGGLLGSEYTGKILSPNSLQSRLQVTKLIPDGSTFKTVEEPYLMTSNDGWFRPIDLKAGPDGAIYVADMYEKRISHVDPRDTWDRSNGRLWRVRPADWTPKTVAMDLQKESAEQLVKRLRSENRWERNTARRVLADRRDAAAVPALKEMLKESGQPALEALWGLNVVGGLDEATLLEALKHREAPVREWAVRLAGDDPSSKPSAKVASTLLKLTDAETEPHVRQQLASTSRRIPGNDGFHMAWRMATTARKEDKTDPLIPLLAWWASEAHVDPQPGDINSKVAYYNCPRTWDSEVGRTVLVPRLSRRLAADANPANQETLAKWLEVAKPDHKKILLAGIKEGFAGHVPAQLSDALKKQLVAMGDPELGLLLGDAAAEPKAMQIVADEKANKELRVRVIEALAQNGKTSGGELLNLIQKTSQKDVRKATITALPHFESAELADGLVTLYPKLAKDVDLKSAAISALLSRPTWAAALVKGVADGKIAKTDVAPADIERLRQFEDPSVVAAVEKVFGKTVRATDAEKIKEIERVKALATTGAGDIRSGKAIFTTRCAVCHTLFNEGGKVGPELTGYDRRNVNDLAINIVDPSAYIREEFASFRVKTKAGEIYVGLITERSGDRLSLVEANQQKQTIAKADIADERPLTVSLMPEGLLAGLSDQEVRDLFKYLSSPDGKLDQPTVFKGTKQ